MPDHSKKYHTGKPLIIYIPFFVSGSTSASTHPAVAVTANPAVEKSLAAGDDSTPDASTHSRSSSKKSNHSVNTIHNGKQ